MPQSVIDRVVAYMTDNYVQLGADYAKSILASAIVDCVGKGIFSCLSDTQTVELAVWIVSKSPIAIVTV